MNILVTGARGFVGKNLVAALRNIRDGKDHTHRSWTSGKSSNMTRTAHRSSLLIMRNLRISYSI